MKKAIISLLVLAIIGGSVFAYYSYRETGPKFTVTSAAVTRGDVVDTVGATGTLQAVTTVQVGTQVSGTIQELHADFNSLVRKGQVLARLDPSLFQTQIEQARANLIRAQADLERLKVALDDARTKLARAQELSGRQLIPKSELDTASVNVRSAEAQLRSSEAQVTQAQASLNQNDVNLQHTIIEAPIDGLVISRNVDVGQTVAASMSAPTLFVLAADLTKMQVVANLDESDVGRIRPGQNVTFRVDAYPADSFVGKVSQVRLEPKVSQNVVTYATVIDVPNDQLKLKPGMTANVNIEIAKSANVLRVPNGALRFRPTNDIYAAIGQAPPDPMQQRAEAGAMRRGSEAPAAALEQLHAETPAAPARSNNAAPPTAGRSSEQGVAAATESTRAPRQEAAPAGADSARGRGGSGGGSGRRAGRGGAADEASAGSERFAARTQGLSPEEREQMLQRMRARGGDPAGTSDAAAGPAPSRGRGGAPTSPQPQATARAGGATTIDALFGPLPRVEGTGRVWLYVEKQLKPVRLRTGISDGQNTEVIEGDLQEGTEVVTNVTTSASTRPAATAFPFGGQPGRGGPGGFPGGGFPAGGGNRGGGAPRGR